MGNVAVEGKGVRWRSGGRGWEWSLTHLQMQCPNGTHFYKDSSARLHPCKGATLPGLEGTSQAASASCR